MIAFLAQGPEGSRFARVRLRIHAMRAVSAVELEEGEYRVSVQPIDGAGMVLAEHPLHVEVMTEGALRAAMDLSQAEGWRVRPCPKARPRVDSPRRPQP